MKFKYLVILVAIVSLFALYGVSLVSHPVQISLSALSEYNGQKVIIQGMVTDYRTTAFGSQLITLRDSNNENNSAVVYLEGEISVEFGDIIQVIGEVQHYKDQWEVTVSNSQFITIVQNWGSQAYPLWQLAEHPEKYRNTNVNVTGIITQKQTSSFILTDPTEKYFIDVSYDTSHVSHFSNGDAVAVAGRFVYNPSLLRFVIQVTNNNHRILRFAG